MTPKRPAQVPLSIRARSILLKLALHRSWLIAVVFSLFALLQSDHFSVPYYSSTSFQLMAQSPGDVLKLRSTFGIYTYQKELGNTTSSLMWDEIAQYVHNVTAGSFCLSWTQGQEAADAWWTHHPDWEVYGESDSGYCFRPIADEDRRNYMSTVYQNQFQNICSNLFVTRMWSSGWSADITNLIHTLQFGLLHGQTMQITSNPWHYAAPDQANRGNKLPSPPACPQMNMYCYFLNLTNCPIQNPDSFNREYDYRNPPRLPPRALKSISEYIVRPQTWLRHTVHQFVQQQRQTSIPTTSVPCTVIHVRRGDVLHHGNISRRYHAISEYLDVERLRDASSSEFTIHKNILLLTDDANAITEAKKNFPDRNWMYIQRPRFQADEGGWEHQLPSSNPIFEMTVLLGTFRLVQQCQSIVYSTSGFSKWLLDEMRKVNPRVGHCNLDDVFRYELGAHNIESKVLSMVYQGEMN